jgi:hypothetical protein
LARTSLPVDLGPRAKPVSRNLANTSLLVDLGPRTTPLAAERPRIAIVECIRDMFFEDFEEA